MKKLVSLLILMSAQMVLSSEAFIVNGRSQNNNLQNPDLVVVQPTNPQEECIPAEDMTAIAKAFPQFQNLSGKPYCFDGSQTAYLMAGLNYIRKVQFVEPMVNSPDDLFTGKFAKDWFGYFTKLVKTIQIAKNCPVGAIAYVNGFFHNNTMHVCPMGLTNAFTPLDLASIFLHEARHIDGFPHTTCNEGPRARLPGACDKKISEGGSYAVTVETYTQLGKYGKDIHPAFRSIAQASALIYGAEAFVQPMKINSEENFLVLTQDNKLYKIDSQNIKAEPQYLGTTIQKGQLIKSKLGLVILPDDRSKLMTRLFQDGETQALSLEYNDDNVSNRAKVVDYYFAWTWNARIEKNKVRFFCDKRQKPTQFVDVALNAEAIGIVYPNGYQPVNAEAYLLTQNGVVTISCLNASQAEIKPAAIDLARDIVRVHKIRNQSLALTQTGQLLDVNANTVIDFSSVGGIKDITTYSRAVFFDQ